MRLRSFGLIYGALVLASASSADDKAAMRVLRDECIGCHKPGKAKGGLILNTREKMMKGGDSGASVVEGKGTESFLYEVLLEDGDPHMPPKKQLDKEQIAAVKSWIDSGAKWDASVFDELPPVKPVALGKLPEGYEPVLALTLSPDETKLAVTRAAGVDIYDLGKPERPLLQHLSGHTEAIQSIAWSPDGKWIATGGFRSLKLWDVETWREVKALSQSLVGNITSLVFTADSKQLLASDGEAGVSGFIHRVESETGKLLGTWKAHDDSIYGMKLSPDGKSLATGSADKLARTWNVADGKLIATYEGHTNHVLAVAFDKDAKRLATCSADKEVKVWDVKSREQDVMLGDKKTPYTALVWSADGSALVAVNDKGAGSVYRDLVKHDGAQRSDTGKERKLETAAEMIYSLAVTKDGKTIFGGSHSGLVYVWKDDGKVTAKLAAVR